MSWIIWEASRTTEIGEQRLKGSAMNGQKSLYKCDCIVDDWRRPAAIYGIAAPDYLPACLRENTATYRQSEIFARQGSRTEPNISNWADALPVNDAAE